jgi:hypothetical protein
VNEDPAHDAVAFRKAAEQESERLVQEAERLARSLTEDPELGEEWLRQENLIYGGLIGLGIVMVQALLRIPWIPPR